MSEQAESRQPQCDNSCGWFRAMRSREAFELLNFNPHAFILAYVIAYRGQYSAGFNRYNLAMGEAFLGDWDNIGLTEANYRTAKAVLKKHGFATFRTTNKGTIGKLADSRLFSIFRLESNGQNNGQLTDGQRTDNGQLTTTKNIRRKDVKIERKGEAPRPALWQLSKDEARLTKQIRERKEATMPDDKLIRGLQAELRSVREQIRQAGNEDRNPNAENVEDPHSRNAGTYNAGKAHEYGEFMRRQETMPPIPRNVGTYASVTDYAAAAAKRSAATAPETPPEPETKPPEPAAPRQPEPPPPPPPTFEPPTLAEVEAFFETLRKGTGKQAGQWFEQHGADPTWTTADWHKPAAKWLFDALRKTRGQP